jgi:hypothetical protein
VRKARARSRARGGPERSGCEQQHPAITVDGENGGADDDDLDAVVSESPLPGPVTRFPFS